MNLGVLEVLAGFIYCLQKNGPKKALSFFGGIYGVKCPAPLTQLGLTVIIVIAIKKKKKKKKHRKTPHIVVMMMTMIIIIIIIIIIIPLL